MRRHTSEEISSPVDLLGEAAIDSSAMLKMIIRGITIVRRMERSTEWTSNEPLKGSNVG